MAAQIDRLRDAARDRQRLEVRRDWVGPQAELAAAVNAVARPEATEAMRHSAIEHVWRVQRRARANLFPISDNLSALMALVMADLSESQRETLMNLIYQRNVELTALTFSDGELDQYEGHWVCDEATGDEGFLDEHEDIFWMYDEDQCYWMKYPLQGRSLRKGSKSKGGGKGKQGKSKGKGSSARRLFRPYRKGGGKGKKSGKSSGSAAKANVAEEEVEEEEIEDDALLADKRKRRESRRQRRMANLSQQDQRLMKPKLLWMTMALPTALFPTPLRSSPTTKSGALRAPRESKKKLRMALV